MTGQREGTTGTARPGAAATDVEDALVARLRALSADLAVRPDAEYRAATRERLVAMAAVRTPTARRPPVRRSALRRVLTGAGDAPTPRWRTRLTAGLAGAALTVTALGGMLGAAQGARPGDLLYDVKLAGEQSQLALAGDSQRGPTLLGFASTRLEELSELVGAEAGAAPVVGTTPSGGEAGLAAGPDVDLVLDTLQTMDEQTTEGTAALTSRAVRDADGAALTVLTDWAADQQTGLAELADAVPTAAQGALTASVDLVAAVAERGTGLTAALDCPGGASTAGADELGPLPVPCAAAPPTEAGEPAAPDSSSAAPEAPAATSAAPSEPAAVPAAPSSPGAPSTPAAPAPTVGQQPSTTAPGAPPAGGDPRTSAAPLPTVTARPGLPTLPLPGAPSTTTSTPAGSWGTLLPLPPVVPGIEICVGRLITVGC